MSWFHANTIFYLTSLGLVFGGVISLVLAFRYLMGTRSNVLGDRLRRVTGARHAGADAVGTRDVADSHGLLAFALAPLAKLATPHDLTEQGQLRTKLVQAGFRSDRAQVVYLGLKVLLSLSFGLLAVWFESAFPQPFTLASLLIIAMMAAGFYLPSLYLRTRIRDRQSEINHSLPNALDLLVTCVEAGLGLDAALNRVSSELGLSAPLLAHEFRQTALEMQAGLPRGDAFRRMAQRTGAEEIRSLAAIIVQTQMFGTSVAKSLRVQAESMRVRRMQIAEERAASVSVKMTIPLIFCIVPALFVALIGPGVVRIIRVLMPALGGGG